MRRFLNDNEEHANTNGESMCKDPITYSELSRTGSRSYTILVLVKSVEWSN